MIADDQLQAIARGEAGSGWRSPETIRDVAAELISHRDVDAMPLDRIERELDEIRRIPRGQRSVLTVERLRELERARQRILGHRGGGGCRGTW